MAKTKEQQQQQLLVIYLRICLVLVSLLMKVDSVTALSIPLDGSGSMLQHQEQQQVDNNVQERNYIMDQTKQRPTAIVPKDPDVFEDDDDDDEGVILKENILNDDLTGNQLNVGHPFKSNAMVKRGPGGFVGMRGKKLYNYDDNNTENDEDVNYNLPWNQLQNVNEDINWNQYAQPNARRYKKIPTTFYGVRGKKFTTMNVANSNNDNHRWHDFLQQLEEERVRDTILQNFVERLAGTQTDLTNDLAKRTPTGFTGVRGKRPFLDELDSSMETLTKRGLGNNAFVGVRGKKDVSHQAFKRSPAWAESLSGRNGKRQNLNNKFIAVRGKKTSYNESPSSAMSLLYGKRTPNGFFGVRGKRPFTTDDI